MNKIVYGKPASGKTENYFKVEAKEWNGKVLAMSCKDEEIEGFKKFSLNNFPSSVKEFWSYDKILVITNAYCDPY